MFPRILFFKLLFTILDGADGAAAIGEVKSALRTRGACSEWTIQPMLDHLRPRLGEESFRFITALAAALCDASAIARMEGYPQWSSAGLVTVKGTAAQREADCYARRGATGHGGGQARCCFMRFYIGSCCILEAVT